MPKLLFDESPMVFQRTLAAWIGLNEAIAIQELNYKLKDVDGHRMGKVEDGVKWYRNSIQEWHKIFTFWDERTITRTFDTLESDGLIISKTFRGRCKWYTVNYAAVDELLAPLPRMQAIKEKRKAAGKASKEAKKQRNMTKCPIEQYDKVSEYNMTNCHTSKTSSKTSSLSSEIEKKEIAVIDPLTDIVETAKRGVKEITAPNPDDQWLVYANEMEKSYSNFLGRCLSIDEKSDIASYVQKYPNDTPQDFADLLTECRHNWTGYGHCPWSRIIEVKDLGGKWEQWKEKENSKNDKGSKPKKLKPGEVDWGTGGGQQTLPDGRVIVW